MDSVEHLRHDGLSVVEALVHSGRRRLRPVLMTSLTAFLGLLPLAYGVGAGADMLKPLAVGVIGALCISLMLSLVATPVVYYVLVRVFTPVRFVPRGLVGERRVRRRLRMESAKMNKPMKWRPLCCWRW